MKDLKQTIITKLKDNAKLTLKDDSVDMKRVFETDADSMAEICNTHADELAIGFSEWCIRWRVEFSDDTEKGKLYCKGGMPQKYTMDELLTIYKQTL